MMRSIFASLSICLALPACQAPDTTESPAVATHTQGIRNGTREPQILPLTEGQTLALGWLHPRGRADGNFCTGTLIAPNVVATARHCIDGRSGRNLAFGIGLLPDDPRASFTVAEAWAHPQVDAAILILAEDAVERVPELEPIPFNREAPWDGLVGSEVEAGGYGETYDPSRSGRYFAVVLLEAIDDVLLQVNGRGRQGVCFGDSGGPTMIVNPEGQVVVLGVLSGGDSSCLGRDRFTRLDILTDWIDGLVNGERPESECGDIDFLGQCDGQVAQWCQNGIVEERDCGRRGEICTFIDDDTGYFCTDAPPCGDIDSRGVCEDDTVVRCRFGNRVYEDCTRSNEVCRTDASGAFCAAPQPPEPPMEPAPMEPDMAMEPDPPEPDLGVDASEPDQGVDAELPPAGGREQSARANDDCSTAPGQGQRSWWMLGLLGLMVRRRQMRE